MRHFTHLLLPTLIRIVAVSGALCLGVGGKEGVDYYSSRRGLHKTIQLERKVSRNLIIGVQRQHCTHLSVVAARIGGRRKVRGIILLHNKQQLAPAAMVGVWSTIKFKCNNVARGIKNERMRSVRQPIFFEFSATTFFGATDFGYLLNWERLRTKTDAKVQGTVM